MVVSLLFCWMSLLFRHTNPIILSHPSSNSISGSLLWFGWLGFNGGSALSVSDGVAARAVATTFVAAASSMLSWLMLERLLKGLEFYSCFNRDGRNPQCRWFHMDPNTCQCHLL